MFNVIKYSYLPLKARIYFRLHVIMKDNEEKKEIVDNQMKMIDQVINCIIVCLILLKVNKFIWHLEVQVSVEMLSLFIYVGQYPVNK